MRNKIKFSRSLYLPFGAVIFGLAMFVFGVAVSLEYLWPGLAMIFCSGLFFSIAGVEVCFETNRIRNYVIVYGIKRGKWKSLDQYTDIAVLSGRYKSTTFSRANTSSTYRGTFFKVYLLSKTHYNKFLLFAFNDLDKAKSTAKEYGKKLNKELTTYQPDLNRRK